MSIGKLSRIGAFAASALLAAAVLAAWTPQAAAKRANAPNNRQVHASQSEERGRQLYAEACVTCHMADGTGTPGRNPPLIKTTYVLGGEAVLVRVVVNGMTRPIQVDNESFNGAMPSFSNLTDQQIADVLTYVRSSFGNRASAVTPAQVRAARRKSA